MNLYRISQEVNQDYDTYDSAVVCAETEEGARSTHPSGSSDWDGKHREYGDWTDKENVKVELIGVADPTQSRGVICASFNAG